MTSKIISKFGKAALEKENLCRPSEEDVYLEPVQSVMADDEETFWIESIEQAAALLRPVTKYKAARYDEDPAASASAGASAGAGAVAGGAGGVGGKYVPPSRREGAASGPRFGGEDDRDDRTLRVTNLSETVKEGDITELFSKAGRVHRVFVAKNPDTKMCRGFAFVTMATKETAKKAIELLDGHGYDHLILKVEWAKPV
jgi:translation initiation factor 3 subunit G